MARNMKLIVLAGFLTCAWSSSQVSVGNPDFCPAGETLLGGRGRSIMQISSSYTAVRSQMSQVPDVAPMIHDLVQGNGKVKCSSFLNASAVPLDSTGFASIQSQCCPPVMADFIERLITKDGNAVCNIGALNGLASFYDCPGDKSFSELTTDIDSSSPAQSGNCAWIRRSQAPSCPVMQASCPHFPQTASSAPPTPSVPSTPSTPPIPSTPVGPPAPPPATSAPCNALPTSAQPTTATTTQVVATTTTVQASYTKAVPSTPSWLGNEMLVYDVTAWPTKDLFKCFDASPYVLCTTMYGASKGTADHGKWIGYALRFLASNPFDYKVLKISDLDSDLIGYWDIFSSGKYAYLPPYWPGGSVPSGKFARFDLESMSAASVQVFDLTTVDPKAKGFFGGFAFAGYAYLPPGPSGPPYQLTKAVRVDLATFSVAKVVDLGKAGYQGGIGHGDHVYFTPHYRYWPSFGDNTFITRVDVATFSIVEHLSIGSAGFNSQAHVPFYHNGYVYVAAAKGPHVGWRFDPATFATVEPLMQLSGNYKLFHPAINVLGGAIYGVSMKLESTPTANAIGRTNLSDLNNPEFFDFDISPYAPAPSDPNAGTAHWWGHVIGDSVYYIPHMGTSSLLRLPIVANSR